MPVGTVGHLPVVLLCRRRAFVPHIVLLDCSVHLKMLPEFSIPVRLTHAKPAMVRRFS